MFNDFGSFIVDFKCEGHTASKPQPAKVEKFSKTRKNEIYGKQRQTLSYVFLGVTWFTDWFHVG